MRVCDKKFSVETYADMFQRKTVIAYTSDGEYYGDVTSIFQNTHLITENVS